MASPRKFLVLAKAETTQFTDSVPVAGTNAILVKNLRATPLRVESEDRALQRPYFGNSEQLPVMEEAVVEFDVEMAGGGTPLGTAPKWGVLMKGCGFGEAIVASTSVTYTPVSTAFDYLTLYIYRDGLIYKLTGAHGSLSLQMNAKRIPHWHFRFVGKYVPVADAAVPAGTFTGFQVPVASIPTFMGTCTIDSYAAKLAAFSLDMRTEISHALWMNAETLQPIDRKPGGSVTFEQVLIATKNYFDMVRNASSVAATITQGITSGNRVAVSLPRMQLTDIAEAEYEGTSAFTANFTANPNAGNDEVSILCT